jgi:hypothetical protein
MLHVGGSFQCLASLPPVEEPLLGHCTTSGRAPSWPLYHRWKSPSLATVPPVEEPLPGHCTTGGRAPPWPLYHRWKSPFLATVPPVEEPLPGHCTTVGRAPSWPLYHCWKGSFLFTVPLLEEPLTATVPPVAKLHYLLDMLLCRHYSNFGHSEEDENVCLSQESNVKSPVILPRSPVTVRTDPCVNEW